MDTILAERPASTLVLPALRRVPENPVLVGFLAGYGRGSGALAEGLGQAGFAIRCFDRFSPALREAARIQPDLVVAGDDGSAGDLVRFLAGLQEASPGSMRLFLSRRADPTEVNRALRAGAHDVLSPPHSVRAIAVRWQVQTRRSPGTGPWEGAGARRSLTVGEFTVTPVTGEVVVGGCEPFTLGGRELELLVILMEAGGGVVTRGELLFRIWGGGQEAECVLDTTVHRLRRRIQTALPGPDPVATVRGIGYRLCGRATRARVGSLDA